MSEFLDLTISIVSGGQLDLTLDCLKSLTASLDDSITHEVFLVDNASTNQTGAKAQALFPQIKVIKNEKCKGFGFNHNQVMSLARGRYVLVLNDDTVVQPFACQKLVASGDQHPEAGFFGPRLLNVDGTLQRSAYRFPSPQLAFCQALRLNKVLPCIFDDYSYWQHDTVRCVDFLSGAALMVRREVIDQVGVFDERYYMYAEETDWCLRAARAGWKVLFIPNVKITHLGGQSTLEIKPQRSVEMLRSHDYFLKKHYGLLGWIIYKFFFLLKHIPRLLLSRALRWTPERQAAEADTVLWSMGLLRRPGLSEIAEKDSGAA